VKMRLLDLLERSAWTFVQAFAATVAATGKIDLLALKIGAGAGILAVLKSLSVATSVKAGEELVKDAVPSATLTTSSAVASP